MTELPQDIGEELLEEEDDGLQPGDEVPMEADEDPNDCEECGSDLTENKVMKRIGGTNYCFCSNGCITNFLGHFG